MILALAGGVMALLSTRERLLNGERLLKGDKVEPICKGQQVEAHEHLYQTCPASKKSRGGGLRELRHGDVDVCD